MQATTTTDLLRQVRNQIRESNPNGITDQEILDTLNRGQNRAVEVMTRNWIYNYLAQETITTSPDGTFTIPEQARGNRIVNIEVDRRSDSSEWGSYSLKKLNYKNVSQFKNTYAASVRPIYYSVQGRTATVYPQVACEIKITYVRNPEKIVKNSGYIYEIVTKTVTEDQQIIPASAISQLSSVDGTVTVEWADPSFESFYVNLIQTNGETLYIDCQVDGGSTVVKLRATGIDSGSVLSGTSISLDDGETYQPVVGTLTYIPLSGFECIKNLGQFLDYILVSDFDPEQVTVEDSYSKASYFNIIDAQTGLVKVSLQASPISGKDEVTGQFKLYPMEPYKQKVLNRPITSPSVLELSDLGFEEDDQICSTYGSSVLEIDTILENFVIQYAVTEIRRSLGNQDMVSEVQVLSQFEKDIRRAHLNRDSSRRIQFKTSTFVKGRYRFNLLR